VYCFACAYRGNDKHVVHDAAGAASAQASALN
jgi:hypothetical protein